MLKSTLKFIFGIVFVLLSGDVFSQLDNTHYLPPLHSRNDNQIQDHYLYLSTPEPTPFQVTITDGAGNILSTQMISDGNPARYDVGVGQLGGSPLFISRAEVYTTLVNKGLILTGANKFFAEVRTRSNAQAESYTAKGLSAVGNTFRLGGFPQVLDGSADRNFTIGIMSVDNGNTVTISNYDAGVTFVDPVGTVAPANVVLNLNAGETFVLTGYSDVPQNLDGIIGALVQSTGNIVITNGNLNGNIHPTSGARDNAIDQIVPIENLGVRHVIVEGNGAPAMEKPFVIAHTDNTEIYINGSVVPFATINAGDYIYIPNNMYQGGAHRNMFVETSNPAYVYQALAGGTSEANGGLNLIPPIHCRLKNSINLIPDINRIGATVYNGGMFIVTEAGANVTVNGAVQTGAEPVQGSPYESYKITGAVGDQVVVSTASVMVGVFGSSGAAAYSGYYSGFADIPKGKMITANNEYCTGTEDTLVFVGSNGTAPYTFFYTMNGDTLSGSTNSDTLKVPVNSLNPDTLNFQLYNILSYDVDGFNSCLYSINDTTQIIYKPLPEGKVIGDTSVCQNENSPSVTFVGSNATAPYTFYYSLNGGALQNITAATDSVSITVPTTIADTFNYELISIDESSALTCSQLQPDTATVIINPVPHAVITGDTSVCQNSAQPTITFTGSLATAPYTFQYNINGGPIQTITSVGDNAYLPVPTNIADTLIYELTGVTESSSLSCGQVLKDTVIVIINPTPQAVILGDTSICQDDVSPIVTFVGSNATAPYTFYYSLNGGPVQSITAPIGSVSLNAPTNMADTLNYELISIEESSSLNCSLIQEDTATIIVNPLPDVTLIGDTSVCQYEAAPSVVFTGNSATNPYTFTYEINGAGIQTATSIGNTANIPVPTILPGIYHYELISLSDAGNPSCSRQINDTVTVVVQSKPIADWSVTSVCENANSVFADNSSVAIVDNDMITMYDWNFGDGTTSQNQNPTHTYGSENVYDVSLIITTNHGCKDTLIKTATVWPLPEVDFTPTDVCVEFDTEFTDQTVLSNAHTNNWIAQWNWDFGDGNGSNAMNPSHTYQTAGVYTANLEITSNRGCVNDTTITVNVFPKPEANFIGTELTGCSPICPEIISTSTVDNPSTLSNFEWRFSDGTTQSGSSASFGDCIENNGGQTAFYDLELIVTSSEGCVDSHKEINYVEVYHYPKADFSFMPQEPDVMNTEIEFYNNSLYADSYDWDFYMVDSSSKVNPIIDYPAEADEYKVRLVASTNEGCTDTTYSVIELEDVIVFYVPNTFTPDGDLVNGTFQPVFTSGFEPQDINLLIFNRWGEVVFETNNINVGWDGTHLNKEVEEGTYVWRIEFTESMSDKRHIHTGHVNLLK